jgi:hypothetical protein
MSRMPPRWAWLAMFAIWIGCGHPATPATRSTAPVASVPAAPEAASPPRALDDDLPRLADRAVKLYQDWQRAFADAGTNCADAATRMNALADANADLIAANNRLVHAGHDKIKAARGELEKHSAEIDPAAQAIMRGPTMSACKQDAAFNSALERLAGEG